MLVACLNDGSVVSLVAGSDWDSEFVHPEIADLDGHAQFAIWMARLPQSAEKTGKSLL